MYSFLNKKTCAFGGAATRVLDSAATRFSDNTDMRFSDNTDMRFSDNVDTSFFNTVVDYKKSVVLVCRPMRIFPKAPQKDSVSGHFSGFLILFKN